MTAKQELEMELREEARHNELMHHDSDYFIENTNFQHIFMEWQTFKILCIRYGHDYEWYKEEL